MTAHELLVALQRAGVDVRPDGDDIVCECRGPDTGERRRLLGLVPALRAELLAVIRARDGIDPAPGAMSLDSRFADGGNRENRETETRLTPLPDLLAEPVENVCFLVEDILPTAGVSALAAKPKVGKTTLARNLALCVARGEPFLGRTTARGPVVYFALEEKRAEVARHFGRMGARDELIFVHVGSAPTQALEALEAAITEHHAVLAIVDPLFRMVRIKDGNDYAEVTRKLEPLISLARQTGCHILCVHHMGKGERSGGDAILGSTAIFGTVDTALMMKRRESGRSLESTQRYGVDLPETVIALDPDTGCVAAAGELEKLQLADAVGTVVEVVGEEKLTEKTIRERVGGNQRLTATAIRQAVTDGKLHRSGAGTAGHPYYYAAANRANPDNRANRDDGGPTTAETTVDPWATERPDVACRSCGSHDWYTGPTGGWICGVCHPRVVGGD